MITPSYDLTVKLVIDSRRWFKMFKPTQMPAQSFDIHCQDIINMFGSFFSDAVNI